MASMPERLILASASSSRAAMLRAAGVTFAVEPATIAEDAVKRRFYEAHREAVDCAMALAEAKAQIVAQRHPGALVVGADQILVCEADWFDKPCDLAEAAAHLRRLRGRSHMLVTAVCAIKDSERLWLATSQPKLTMRRFGDGFLDRYIATEGEVLLGSVGAYRMEERGVQLFEKIEGDHFAILGLPLIELLEFLRRRGIVER
jgi:septum formation protein